MSNQEVITKSKKIIGDYLAEKRFELAELIYRYEGKDLVLRLLVDKPEGGITLGECALLNRQLRVLLEEKDIISFFVLEVSSPGLDRSLKTKEDFIRCLNKQAVFFLNDLVNGKCEWKGLISRVNEAAVFIDLTGEVLEIPLIKINKAKLVIQENCLRQ